MGSVDQTTLNEEISFKCTLSQAWNENSTLYYEIRILIHLASKLRVGIQIVGTFLCISLPVPGM